MVNKRLAADRNREPLAIDSSDDDTPPKPRQGAEKQAYPSRLKRRAAAIDNTDDEVQRPAKKTKERGRVIFRGGPPYQDVQRNKPIDDWMAALASQRGSQSPSQGSRDRAGDNDDGSSVYNPIDPTRSPSPPPRPVD